MLKSPETVGTGNVSTGYPSWGIQKEDTSPVWGGDRFVDQRDIVPIHGRITGKKPDRTVPVAPVTNNATHKGRWSGCIVYSPDGSVFGEYDNLKKAVESVAGFFCVTANHLDKWLKNNDYEYKDYSFVRVKKCNC